MKGRVPLSKSIALALALAFAIQAASAQVAPPRGPGRRPGGAPTNQPGIPPGTTGNPNSSQGSARGFVPPGIDLVAGVRLDRPAEMPASLTDVQAVAYDAQQKRLYLVGRHNKKLPAFRTEDLAVVLKVVGSGFPGVSIEGPMQDGQMTVKYYGDIENTHFGQVLFEADRQLKSLVLGRDNITKEFLRPRVSGYESEVKKLRRMGGTQRPKAWHRYWFSPALISMTESEDRQALRFDQVKIQVRTEYVPALAEGESEPAAEEFAAHFTEHYDEFAAIYPVFAELRELAKVTALAQWLKDNNIPTTSLNFDTAVVPKIETPKTTPVGYAQALALMPEGLWKHQMEGGVTLRLFKSVLDGERKWPGNWTVTRNETATDLLKSVLKKPSEETRKWLATYKPAPAESVTPTETSNQ